MKLHNTLTKQVEDFEPIKDKAVNLYSCGPTVYDHIHIGNLSSFIMADTLHRVLKANDYKVHHVMNFTDVDDKTIKRSAEQHPNDEPMVALRSLTKHYSEIFLNDLAAVGVDVEAMAFISATDSIDQMQQLIRELYRHEFAYITEDGVYFSIEAYKQSGKKYGQLTEVTTDSTSQARIRNDEYDKESAHDFALWKLKTNNEPHWEFELDGHHLEGRPGWHIECSAMSQTKLGQPFDIHTGGVDLIFPHHENEIAQSTAGKDNPILANYFVHNEHLLVDGKKMSKSLNNFFTLRDIIEKGYDPLAFRLMVLQSHYRSQSNFTWEILEAAQNALKNIEAWADLQFQDLKSDKLVPSYKTAIETLKKEMNNDLNTSAALAVLNNMINQVDSLGADSSAISIVLPVIEDLFGLGLDKRKDITSEQISLIADRQKARLDSDWAKSDDIRNKLEVDGIGLKDTAAGAIWFRL